MGCTRFSFADSYNVCSEDFILFFRKEKQKQKTANPLHAFLNLTQ